MEKLRGPINPCLLAEHLDVDCFQQEFTNTESLGFGNEEATSLLTFSLPSLNEKMSFLQMLQTVETPQLISFQDPNFQTLLRLQQQNICMAETKPQIRDLELESCVTKLHSPTKSEIKFQRQPNSPETGNQRNEISKAPPLPTRKRRKRARPAKNKEEIENQRMTHIVVERNRRRQMNDHLNALRSLMPASYVQRGDQASIIGGAIGFVKELEQLLLSLEGQKRIRNADEGNESSSSTSITAGIRPESSFTEEEIGPEVETTVIQNHVNLKIRCPRRAGQLLKAIVALENLRLTVLHLNVASSESSVHYCFNLKIQEDCVLGSSDEISAAVHQIFRLINGP